MLEKMKNLVVEEEGQGMVEYGLIIAISCYSCSGRFNCLGTIN